MKTHFYKILSREAETRFFITLAAMLLVAGVTTGLVAQAQPAVSTLQDLKSSIKMLQKDSKIACTGLANTTNVHILSPNVLGTVNIPPIPLPSGTIAMPAPVDRGLVNASLLDMNKLLNKIRQQEKAVMFPANVQEDLGPSWRRILALTDNMVRHYNTLVKLSSMPRSSRLRMGKETLAIHDTAAEIRHQLNPLFSTVRRNSQGVGLAARARNWF